MLSARGWVVGLHRGGGGLGGLGGGGAAGGGGALCAAAGGWRPRPRRGSHPRHVRHAAAHTHRLGIQVLASLLITFSCCFMLAGRSPRPTPTAATAGCPTGPGARCWAAPASSTTCSTCGDTGEPRAACPVPRVVTRHTRGQRGLRRVARHARPRGLGLRGRSPLLQEV